MANKKPAKTRGGHFIEGHSAADGPMAGGGNVRFYLRDAGRGLSGRKNDRKSEPRALLRCHSVTIVGLRWPSSRPLT